MKMSAEFLASQKEALEKEKQSLEEKIKLLKKYPDYGGLTDDQAQELTDFETNQSLDDNLEVLLKKVKAALKSINVGTYGQCRSCSDAIERGRLEAIPYADLCVTCQNKK